MSIRTQLIFIAAAVLLAVLAMKMKTCKTKKAIVQVATAHYDSVKYWRDRWGTEHATKLLVVGSKATIEALYKHEMDSVCKRLGLREKQLQSMSEVLMQARGQVVATVDTVYLPDTSTLQFFPQGKVRRYAWADEYLTLDIQADTVRAQVLYKIQVPLVLTTYWKRKHPLFWVLSKKRYYIDGYSENPNVHISNIRGIRIN